MMIVWAVDQSVGRLHAKDNHKNNSSENVRKTKLTDSDPKKIYTNNEAEWGKKDA